MNRTVCAAIGLVGALILGPGCGPGTPAPAKATGAAAAGPNSRIKINDEYKKMLDKDGKPLWKPGQDPKRLPGFPKS